MCRQLWDNLGSTWRRLRDNLCDLWTTWGPFGDGFWTTWWKFVSCFWITLGPLIDHFWPLVASCDYFVSTNDDFVTTLQQHCDYFAFWQPHWEHFWTIGDLYSDYWRSNEKSMKCQKFYLQRQSPTARCRGCSWVGRSQTPERRWLYEASSTARWMWWSRGWPSRFSTTKNLKLDM